MSEPDRCKETVYIRDTLRYSGRGRSGFSLHYHRQQCSRPHGAASDYCWQHDPNEIQRRRQKRMARAAEPRGEG